MVLRHRPLRARSSRPNFPPCPLWNLTLASREHLLPLLQGLHYTTRRATQACGGYL